MLIYATMYCIHHSFFFKLRHDKLMYANLCHHVLHTPQNFLKCWRHHELMYANLCHHVMLTQQNFLKLWHHKLMYANLCHHVFAYLFQLISLCSVFIQIGVFPVGQRQTPDSQYRVDIITRPRVRVVVCGWEQSCHWILQNERMQ